MAKSAKRRNKKRARRATTTTVARRRPAARNSHRRRTKKRNGTRIVVVSPKRNSRRRSRFSRNPIGTNISHSMKNVAAALAGMAVNKLVLPMLPETLTSSNIAATAAALAVAAGQWYIGTMVSKEFGGFFGLGGAIHAVGQGLNTFIPSVGGYTGIGSGMGDFVPGAFAVPQNPVLTDGVPSAGTPLGSAYPGAYRIAA